MCDFTSWTARGVRVDLGTFADLTAREGPSGGGPSMMLTLMGVGTCEHPEWRHSLTHLGERIATDPTLEVFQVVATSPGGAEPLTRAVVEWTGPVRAEATRVELGNARADGGSVFIDIEVLR